MRNTFLIVYLLLCITPTAFSAQVPLFSGFNLNPQFYNPAYAAYLNKYELSYLGGYGTKGVNSYETFHVENRSTKQIVEGSNVFDDPNYSNFAIALPIHLKKNKRLGVGFSYTNNDMQQIETYNTMGFSLAYNWDEKIGRFAFGFNVKRLVVNATDKRIYYSYDPKQEVIFQTYNEKQGNWDLGLMFSNDSGTLDIGLSVCDVSQSSGGFGAISVNGKYGFVFRRAPNVVAITNFQLKITKNLTSKNNFIAATNNGLKSTNFLARSLVCYKAIGLGIQYGYKYNSTIGPALSFSNDNFDVFYSFMMDTNHSTILMGFHEIGTKVKI